MGQLIKTFDKTKNQWVIINATDVRYVSFDSLTEEEKVSLKGDTGTLFTPSVAENGDLSWTNDGGLANPATVNIKGPKGNTGDTGPIGPKGADGTVSFNDLTAEQKESLRGPKGNTGDTGPIGPVGPAGPAPSISTQNTGDGTIVTFVGSNTESFTIHNGEPGATGEKGNTGDSGIVYSSIEPTDKNVIWAQEVTNINSNQMYFIQGKGIKRIEFVNTYPTTQETDVLYIKYLTV